MKLTMLLLTGIGLILCMIAFIILVIIFIINDIKEHKAKVGNIKMNKQIEQMDIILVIIFIINDIKEHKAKVGNIKMNKQIEQMDARTKAINIITSERVQALEDAGLMIVDRDEIDRLKKKIDVILQDFHHCVQGGKEICAFCLYDDECEPGEKLCGATCKDFKSRWLNEK